MPEKYSGDDKAPENQWQTPDHEHEDRKSDDNRKLEAIQKPEFRILGKILDA